MIERPEAQVRLLVEPGCSYYAGCSEPAMQCGYCRTHCLCVLRFTPGEQGEAMSQKVELPLHRTEAGFPNCSTCEGGGCLDCTDPA